MGSSDSSHTFTRLPTLEEDNVALLQPEDGSHDGSESSCHDEILDGLLSKVGYGTFQKRLLIMCGFGWLADNMWLQCVAIILPRVQEHFEVSDKWIGTVSSALFTGMTFGAFFWGTYSDSRGRKIPFTLTLAITTTFGLLSSLAFSFWSLCLMLFFLGFGVGGNMPTDGALYLEFLPKEYHYLLTFMSVFFSFGAVLASILGYTILPYTSCPEPTADNPNPSCDVATQNSGWRILLVCAALTTLAMLLVRSLWLKLPETPKFLLSQDRHQETIIVLQDIARINGEHVRIGSADLPRPTSAPISDGELHLRNSEERREHWQDDEREREQEPMIASNDENIANKMVHDVYKSVNASAWSMLFSPQWRVTTILVWAIWTFTSMAYTMFNVFLPKYLETLGFQGEVPPTRKDVYWDYMIYSLAGVPGSVLASYMIETFLGRKGTMAASAFGSSLALFLFSIIQSRVTMLLSSSAVSFLATLLYAVIYGYTPEVFDTLVRGTAVGTASGLGRIAGIISPIACGILFTIAAVFPLYVSMAGFGIVGTCVLLLPYETRTRQR